MNIDLREAERVIGYTFRQKRYLERALTHSSYNKEKCTCHQDNERLEFLGDAFFDAIVSEALFHRMQEMTEGKLTKTRALIVCERSLAAAARQLRIGRLLLLGRGEESAGGRQKDSILADAMEAIIGAIFLDGGYEPAREFVLRTFSETIEQAIGGQLFSDYKSELQELLQKKGTPVSIVYGVDHEEGPAHDKTFYVYLKVDGVIIANGVGKSKKEAEQQAAGMALRRGEAHVL